jgi:excisionase family DNA binding protein
MVSKLSNPLKSALSTAGSQSANKDYSKSTYMLLNILQCSKALNVSTWTVRRLIKNGSLPKVQIGSRVLVRAADLERFVEMRTSSSCPAETASPTFAADEDVR